MQTQELKIDFKEELDKIGKPCLPHTYELDGNNKYIIKEDKYYFEHNCNMLFTIEALGGMQNQDCKRIIKDYNNIVYKVCPAGDKKELASYYGKGPIWKNNYTQGIVVKLLDNNIITYEILVECSNLCTGFKYSKFVPSDAECYKVIKSFYA